MKTQAQNRFILGIIGVFSLSLAAPTSIMAQTYPIKTNHFGHQINGFPTHYGVNTGVINAYPAPFMAPVKNNFGHNYPYRPQNHLVIHQNPGLQTGIYNGQYGHPNMHSGHRKMNRKTRGYNNGPMGVPKYDGFMARLKGQKTLPHQIPAPRATPGNMFQRWVEYEPHYTFYPGDQLDIVVASAPELSRSLTVGPDGRVSMPLVDPIMAAGRPLAHIQNDIRAQLAKQLVDPAVTVTPRAFAPAQIYVGGEVNAQGTYALPGPVGALEAVIMAGGMRASAKSSQIAVLRRAPNGGMMMRSVNISNGMRNIREYNDNMQLRRGDIIFVPRTTLAEVGNFMQALRNAIPVDFNVSYNIGQNGGGTDPAILNNGTTTTITP